MTKAFPMEDLELMNLLEASGGSLVKGNPQAVVELLNAALEEEPTDPAQAWPPDEEDTPDRAITPAVDHREDTGILSLPAGVVARSGASL